MVSFPSCTVYCLEAGRVVRRRPSLGGIVRQKTTARISFRVNPGVDPVTFHKVNTGISESKFGVHLEGGIALSAYRRASSLPGLAVVGLHAHIGSQIVDPAGHVETLRRLLAFALELKRSLGIVLEFVDAGGGIGIPYEDGQSAMSPDGLASALAPVWAEGTRALGYEPELRVEPGRWFVGPAGYLLARVNTVKRTPVRLFLNVDAGFNTLMRPSMYGAYHRVRVVGRTDHGETVDVAGDVCETETSSPRSGGSPARKPATFSSSSTRGPTDSR